MRAVCVLQEPVTEGGLREEGAFQPRPKDKKEQWAELGVRPGQREWLYHSREMRDSGALREPESFSWLGGGRGQVAPFLR